MLGNQDTPSIQLFPGQVIAFAGFVFGQNAGINGPDNLRLSGNHPSFCIRWGQGVVLFGLAALYLVLLSCHPGRCSSLIIYGTLLRLPVGYELAKTSN
jgi:hypothetical protein